MSCSHPPGPGRFLLHAPHTDRHKPDPQLVEVVEEGGFLWWNDPWTKTQYGTAPHAMALGSMYRWEPAPFDVRTYVESVCPDVLPVLFVSPPCRAYVLEVQDVGRIMFRDDRPSIFSMDLPWDVAVPRHHHPSHASVTQASEWTVRFAGIRRSRLQDVRSQSALTKALLMAGRIFHHRRLRVAREIR